MADVTETEMTIKRIENAYQIAAKLVEAYGDEFLQHFEAIHEQLKLIRKRQDIKSIALDIASQYGK